LRSRQTVWCLLFVIIASWFTYFQNYEYPNRFFWDENYNIASAQKYLNDTFYIGLHPPLGRLLMALGQHFISPDEPNNQYLDKYSASHFSEEITMKGYRVFPVLLGWLTAPLLFLIFLLLLKSPTQSMLLSFLFIFDNALVVHLRGAMLEGALLFFSMSTILLFILLVEKRDAKKLFPWFSLLFGITLACAIGVKVLACILVLLIPALLYKLYPNRRQSAQFLVLTAVGFFVTYLVIWQTHVLLTNTPYKDENDKANYYSASEQYRQIIDAGETSSPIGLFMAIRHSIRKVGFQQSAPALNLCKVSENGSPPILWPLGSHAIMYTSATVKDGVSQYLYLQANPVVWIIGLSGVLFSFAYVVSTLFFWQGRATGRVFYVSVFLVMYVGYMIAVSRIDRVMYLYHYFIPLVLSFILFGLSFAEIRSIGPTKLTQASKDIILMILALCIFISFQFYRPLTYFVPISDEALQRRAIFPLWELRCRGCERKRLWANPVNT